jgi:hypothetical protein
MRQRGERQPILLDDAALEREMLCMTDAYTDELFPVTPFEAGRVIFPVSRLTTLRSIRHHSQEIPSCARASSR